MTEKFEKAHPFVKIKVSTELITQLFGENRTPTICLKGLKGDYSCVGIIQNSNTGIFEFLLKNKYCLEGLFAKPFLPEYKRIDGLDKSQFEQEIALLSGILGNMIPLLNREQSEAAESALRKVFDNHLNDYKQKVKEALDKILMKGLATNWDKLQHKGGFIRKRLLEELGLN